MSLGDPTIIKNCIFWDNPPGEAVPQIYVVADGGTYVSFSDIKGGRAGITGDEAGQSGVVWDANSNIDYPPDFVAPAGLDNNPGTYADNDYRLLSDSRLIDAASNWAIDDVGTDLDGHSRFSDGPAVASGEYSAIHDCAIADMGPYEFIQCPTGSILFADPPDGTRDARQPHPPDDNSFGARQGIGSPNAYPGGPDPIVITLDVCGAASPVCWELCETGIEPVDSGLPLSANRIISIFERTSQPGTYEILLDRPISGRHWTRIRYLGGQEQEVSYASLPANANADNFSTPVDILDHIDCCLNCTCHGQCWNDIYRCDIDRNGVIDPADNQRLIALLQGQGAFIVWNGQPLSINTCESGYGSGGGGGGGGGGGNCTDASCGGGMEPLAMTPVGGSGGDAGMLAGTTVESIGTADENAQFSDWFVNYLTTASPADSAAAEVFTVLVDSLEQWCVDQFTPDERAALAGRLSDPLLGFASQAGSQEAARSAAMLWP